MSDGRYATDRKFGDSLMCTVKSILGQHLLRDDFVEEDMKRNTDLMVLKMETKRIGVRIRRYEYYENYKNQFTIRYSRPTKAKTEFEKIVTGWGDLFFYGFANKDGTGLIKWFIGDLSEFRKFAYLDAYKHGRNSIIPRKMTVWNGCEFLAYDLNEIPNFILENSESWVSNKNGSMWQKIL